jgi:hypothetical protein
MFTQFVASNISLVFYHRLRDHFYPLIFPRAGPRRSQVKFSGRNGLGPSFNIPGGPEEYFADLFRPGVLRNTSPIFLREELYPFPRLPVFVWFMQTYF